MINIKFFVLSRDYRHGDYYGYWFRYLAVLIDLRFGQPQYKGNEKNINISPKTG